MSEEKSNFKVRDRRLFNTDGTPRDVEREEEPAAKQEPDSSAGINLDAVAPDAENVVRESAGATAAASPMAEQTGTTATPAAHRFDDGEQIIGASPVDESDSQEFLMIVEFIASFAADALGLVNHPGAGGGREVNPPLAKQCIDMLGTLQHKTRGNLNAEEQQVFEMILSQLRMQYVSLTSAPRAGGGGPRGFSGSDITGGR